MGINFYVLRQQQCGRHLVWFGWAVKAFRIRYSILLQYQLSTLLPGLYWCASCRGAYLRIQLLLRFSIAIILPCTPVFSGSSRD
ncbi:hypothetical protein O9992_29800 [Vibrio lentus]|nr:hypothetical protein [Vibrio lentus]